MRSLLIDNHDSFTYNLFALLAEVNGEEPLVVANDATTWDALDGEPFDNVVVSPGPGHPARPGDLGMAAEAIARTSVPLLGVCLGHQAIGQAFGAVVERTPEPMHGRLGKVRHAGDPLLAGMPTPFTAVRYHSLHVRGLPPALEAIAWGDGDVLMGLRHLVRPLWGVQFHPESICSEGGATLLENFRALTEGHRRAHGPRRPVGRRARVPQSARRPAQPTAADEPLALRTRELPAVVSAEHSFTALYGTATTAFWLDSAAAGDPRSRRSYMGDTAGPLAEVLRYDVEERSLTVEAAGTTRVHRSGVLDHLDARLDRLRVRPGQLPEGFVGGYVGFLGYELKADCGATPGHRAPTPDAALVFADRVVAFDHRRGTISLHALARTGEEAAADAWIEATAVRLTTLQGEAPPPAPEPVRLAPVRFRDDAAAYEGLVARCLEEIADGESYELCLTTSAAAPAEGTDPLRLYRLLRRANPAPYAAFLRLGDLAVLSSSPERFLAVQGGIVETRPIKGTRRRSSDPGEDAATRAALANSEKDLAENLMIVDLARNDLTRSCEPSSVRVPELFTVETYETVHQLVSTVRGCLRAGASPVDAVRAAFPPGSMTGAPKRRSMEILDRLEDASRGPYAGALGFFGVDGGVDLSVVIRTLVVAGDEVRFGVGGAVVALSDPAAEWREALVKAEPLQVALAQDPAGAAPAAPRGGFPDGPAW